MFVSQARIDANRRNALRSTGPKTPEGKARSRANALKHGLCARIVVAEDIQAIQERNAKWFDALMPQDEHEAWMVGEAALLSIRVDRCERIERRTRDKIALRAELSWEDDRKLEAEILGRSLANDPAATVEKLRRTPQGCEWLMTRWALLAHAADTQTGGWTEEQSSLAFDLLSTPPAFRAGRIPGASVDFKGAVVDPGSDPAAVARHEVDELAERRAVVADLDEVDRALTESDLVVEGDPELRKLRRYEATLHRRLRWCLDQLKPKPANRFYRLELRPQWVVDPELEPEPKPEPEPKAPQKTADEVAAESWRPGDFSPPFDLEPDEFPEPGETADVPAILKSRREKRIRKAQARRDDRRRKVERLRG